MKKIIDIINAGTEFAAIITTLLDIKSFYRDKSATGFNIWSRFYWIIYGIWQIFIAFYVGLPLTGCIISIWVPLFSFLTWKYIQSKNHNI